MGYRGRGRLLAGVSFAALGLACSLSTAASAAQYFVGNETELRDAIAAANASPDTSSTIVLTGSFGVSPTNIPTPTKSLTIDTQGFVLSGVHAPPASAGSIRFVGSFPSGTLTLSGAFTGADQGGGMSVGVGVFVDSQLASSDARFVNLGSITGGSATTSGAGGVGLSVLNVLTVVNNGTISGGSGVGGGSGNNASGVNLFSGASLINNVGGVVLGGNSQGTGAGAGVFANAPSRTPTIINYGLIRGGSDLTGLNDGNAAILARGTQLVTISNAGILEGGNNRAAVDSDNPGTSNIFLINNGTIRGGAGSANAIEFGQTATSRSILELWAGSVIEGNVLASAAATNDVFRLGGAASASFDISALGPAGQYQNFDRFEKTGSSTWTLTGIGPFTGPTNILEGRLVVNGSLTGSAVTVQSGGTLGGNGAVGDTALLAGGRIAPGNSIGTLTIAGNYTGNGGTLEIEAVLGGDASPTDRLVVTGDTAGATNVQVINLGGTGAQTVEGIKIVEVGGASLGTFSLLGDYVFQGEQAVVGGAYAYRLYQGGVSTPGDGDWYLRSVLIDPVTAAATPLWQPGVPLYEAYAGVLQAFNQPGTLQQRLGNRAWADGARDGTGLWARIDASRGRFEPKSSTTGTTYDTSIWKLEAGIDAVLSEQPGGRLMGGLSLQYGTISSDVTSLFGRGSIDTSGFGLGASLTWYGDSGFYVDGQTRVTWYDSDLKSSTAARKLADGNGGVGYGLSVEAGQRIALGGGFSLTPQAQLAYSAVSFDDFTDAFGTLVRLDDGDGLWGRLGLSADYNGSWQDAAGRLNRAHVYTIANLYYDFAAGTRVAVAELPFSSKNEALWGGLGLGGSLNFAGDRYSLYGEALVRTGLDNFGDSHVLSGSVGFRAKW